MWPRPLQRRSKQICRQNYPSRSAVIMPEVVHRSTARAARLRRHLGQLRRIERTTSLTHPYNMLSLRTAPLKEVKRLSFRLSLPIKFKLHRRLRKRAHPLQVSDVEPKKLASRKASTGINSLTLLRPQKQLYHQEQRDPNLQLVSHRFKPSSEVILTAMDLAQSVLSMTFLQQIVP